MIYHISMDTVLFFETTVHLYVHALQTSADGERTKCTHVDTEPLKVMALWLHKFQHRRLWKSDDAVLLSSQ